MVAGSSVKVIWKAKARERLKPSAVRKRWSESLASRPQPVRRSAFRASSPSSSWASGTRWRYSWVVLLLRSLRAGGHAQGERPWEDVNYQPAGAAGWVAVPLDRLGPVAVDLDASGAKQLQRQPR